MIFGTKKSAGFEKMSLSTKKVSLTGLTFGDTLKWRESSGVKHKQEPKLSICLAKIAINGVLPYP